MAYLSAISVSICIKLARSILIMDRNIVTMPNFRKSLSKSRILSSKKQLFVNLGHLSSNTCCYSWSIDSDDVSPRPLMRAHAQQPINRQRIIVSPTLAGRYSTTRATLRTSFKVKGQDHKLALSVRLISASS